MKTSTFTLLGVGLLAGCSLQLTDAPRPGTNNPDASTDASGDIVDEQGDVEVDVDDDTVEDAESDVDDVTDADASDVTEDADDDGDVAPDADEDPDVDVGTGPCEGAPHNACGSCVELAGTPGTGCGEFLDLWRCFDGDVECVEGPRDACGNAILVETGRRCGTCDTGTVQCDVDGQLTCVGGSGPEILNECGRCNNATGADCGTITVFEGTIRGGLAMAGNAIGLSSTEGSNAPGRYGTIGTFIAADPTDIEPNWPMGTTDDWIRNGSAASLTLPDGARILHAELIWGGSWQYGNEDVSGQLDSPILMTINAAYPVPPSSETAATYAYEEAQPMRFYTRSGDVTAILESARLAVGQILPISVSRIPATQHAAHDVNAGGWTLAVAYTSDNAPARYVEIVVAGDAIYFGDDEGEERWMATSFDGFCAENRTGQLLVSAMDGDWGLEGDQVQIFSTDAGEYVSLVNPRTANFFNFFGGQLVDHEGRQNGTDTFSTRNHGPSSATTGGRQGWDQAAIDLTSTLLTEQQSSLLLRTILDFEINQPRDLYAVTMLGLEIDVAGPEITADITVTPDDDGAAVSIELTNADAAMPVDTISLRVTLPTDTALLSAEATMNGQLRDAVLSGGGSTFHVYVDALDAGESATITFHADLLGGAAAPFNDGSVLLNYNWTPCGADGDEPVLWQLSSDWGWQ